MEKRKLLLVAVSVGVFLVIVLSAAILIFTPSSGGSILAARPVPAAVTQPVVSASQTGTRGPASADVADLARNPGEIQGLMVPPSGVPAISVATESPNTAASPSAASGQGASAIQENNIYINSETSTPADTTNVVISVPKPATPGIPIPENRTSSPAASTRQGTASGATASPATRTTSPAPAASVTAAPTPSAASSSSTTSGSTPVAAATSAQPSAEPVAKPETAATGSPAQTSTGSETRTASGGSSPARTTTATTTRSTTTRTEARPILDYWIQTGAFSALVRAEDAKENLASKGLSSIIDNREVDGQIWYRVRIGPYTSENEANYWLPLVRAINGFGESQVRSVQR